MGLQNFFSRSLFYVCIATAIYLVAFLPLHNILGDGASAFSLLPVGIASWYLGRRKGLFYSILILLLNLLLFRFVGHTRMDQIMFRGGTAGFIALIGASVAVGWVRTLSDRAYQELTERKNVEEKLRESEEKYRLLFENMVEGIAIDELIYDDQGKVIDWIVQDANPAYEKILNVSRANAIHQRATTIYGKTSELEQFLSDYAQAAKTGLPLISDTRTLVGKREIRLTVVPITQTRIAVIFSDITDQNQTLASEREQRKLAEALRDIAASINSSLRVEHVLDEILKHMVRIASFDAVNLMLIEQNMVKIARYQGYTERGLEDYANHFSRRIEDVSSLAWIAKNRKALVIPYTRQDPGWVIFPETAWISSYAGIPIISKGDLIGFLNFNSSIPGFIRSEIIDHLQPFADQAAVAIVNARAFEASQLNNQRLAIINRVSIMLNRPLELQPVLQATVDGIAEALHLDQVGLALFDEVEQHLTLVADHPAPGKPSLVGSEIPLQGNLSMDHIVSKKSSLLISNAQQDKMLDAVHDYMVQRGVRTILLIPLLLRDQVIGTVGCDLMESGRQFRPEEIELAETLTNLATIRIEQARLFAEEQQRASELAMLHAISLDITMAHELPELLKTIVERAVWFLDANCGTLYQCNPQSQELHCMISSNDFYDHPGNILKYGEGAAGYVAITGQPLIVPNYAVWDQIPPGTRAFEKPFAVLCVPVGWQANVIGVIQLIRDKDNRSFSQRDVALLSLFSNHVAISLEKARLISDIQQLAIQDPLTGLFNRRGLMEIGKREINRSRRFKRPLSGLILDIDHFKTINDTYGHLVGDHMLASLADVCRQNLRSIDIIGRYGGEEFVILLLESDIGSAMQVTERLRWSIENMSFQASSIVLRLTVSIGVAVLEDSMAGLSDLIQAADEALYMAKRAGRNQIKVFPGTAWRK